MGHKVNDGRGMKIVTRLTVCYRHCAICKFAIGFLSLNQQKKYNLLFARNFYFSPEIISTFRQNLFFTLSVYFLFKIIFLNCYLILLDFLRRMTPKSLSHLSPLSYSQAIKKAKN